MSKQILVLNGSPRGENSSTMQITRRFLDGYVKEQDAVIDTVNITRSRIEHCTGCFTCWTKTPGKCIFRDDMDELLEKYRAADLIVWSFPLYYFGMPSKIKAFMDRMLPMNLPFLNDGEGEHRIHPPRYDVSHLKFVLISTCGYHSREHNYDALIKQFDILYHGRLESIICPEGGILNVPQMQSAVEPYLAAAEKAGREHAQTGSFADTTREQLNSLIVPPEVYTELANESWEISGEESSSVPGAFSDPSARLMKQMRAVCRPGEAGETPVVLEIDFTDIGKTWQFSIGEGSCELAEGSGKPFTTRIETPFSLWQEISNGKADGTEAMMQGKYRVQ